MVGIMFLWIHHQPYIDSSVLCRQNSRQKAYQSTDKTIWTYYFLAFTSP
jgi:hypothetical protein